MPNDAGVDADSATDTERDSGIRDAGDAGNPWYQSTTCPTGDPTALINYPAGSDPFEEFEDIGLISSRIAKSGLETNSNSAIWGLQRDSGNARAGSRGWIVNRSGGDIGVSVGITSAATVQERTTGTLTVLMNYESVEQAQWDLIGTEDTEIERSHIGSGFQFPFDERKEVVNVQVPYDAFKEPGYYELAIWLQVGGPSQHILGTALRLSIWNQTAARQPHPCLIQEESRPITNQERSVLNFISGAQTITYKSGEFGTEHLENGISVAPSSLVSTEYFVPSTAKLGDVEYDVALFPTLNGEPIGPTKLLRRPSGRIDASVEPTYFDTLYSGSLEFRAPEEPGVYDFALGMILDPFQPRVLPDGTYGRSFPIAAGRSAKLRINVE